MDDSTIESSRMFWGIVLKPEKRYEQTVQEPFHISKACIEPTTSKGSVTSVFVEVDDADEFIICNLSEKIMNENLDLNFNSGDKICFRTAGTGSVHLTGYNILEEDDGPDDFDFSDDGSEESEAEEVPQLVNGKRKRTSAGSDLNPAKKSNKDLSPLDKLLAEKKQASDLRDKLNAKKEESENIEESDEDEESEDDEDSQDDDDFIAKEAPEGEAEEDDEEDDEGEEEESEDDDADESMETESPAKDIEIKKSPKKEPAGSPKKEPKTPEPAKKKSAESPKKELKTAEPANTKEPAASPKKGTKTPEKAQEEPTESPNVKEQAEPETPKPSASGDANEKSENNTETQSAKKKKKKNKKNKNKENDAGNANAPNTPAPASQEKKDSQKDEKKTPSKPEKPKGEQPATTPGAAKTPSKRTLVGGLMVEDLKVGNGPVAKKGKMVGMYYSGKLKANNKQFDATLSGKPFKFRLGKGEVIKGWDIGVDGMKVGGKRRITVPSKLGYGSEGAAPDIPPNATLVFEVECKGVH